MRASREKGPWFIWVQVRRWLLGSSGSPDGVPQPWEHPTLGYAAALVVPLFTGLILWLLLQLVPGFQCPALLLLLAIVGIALCWGKGPGLVATVLGTCLLAGLFASPLGSGGGKPVAPLAALGVFTGMGVIISLLMSRSRHASQQAEALTRELEAIFEAMADGVVVYDRAGQTRRMNAALRTLMGIAAQSDMASCPFRERLARYDPHDEHGIPLPAEQWPVQRLLQGEVLTGSHTMDLLLQTVDGRQIQVNFSGAPIRDAQGQVIGAVTISRDVTERRQLEREATTRARELEAIFEAIADGIIVYDLQGAIVQMNAATRRLLGFTLHPEGHARRMGNQCHQSTGRFNACSTGRSSREPTRSICSFRPWMDARSCSTSVALRFVMRVAISAGWSPSPVMSPSTAGCSAKPLNEPVSCKPSSKPWPMPSSSVIGKEPPST